MTKREPPIQAAPAQRLVLGDIDLVPDQTVDDTEAGWGLPSSVDTDPATVLRRYLDETPPHHGD